MSKTLIVYFSASGVTEKIAHALAETTGADLFEIKPQQPYTAKDLNWNDRNSRSSVEKNDPTCRPAMMEEATDLGRYETIFVGFPIWWGKAPSVVFTFLDGVALSGKTLIPFATSGGSGISGAERALKTAYPAADWKSGRLLNRTSEISAWLKKIHID